MLRPFSPPHDLEPESDDPDAFGGLANVLEPDDDEEAATSVSMRRGRPGGPSVRAPSAPPVSIRAPVQVQDFAFADTVFASELPEEDDPPPSLPIFFDAVRGSPQCATPLAFPLPDAAADVDFATRGRVFLAHVRHGVRAALEEIRELWTGTADIVYGQRAGQLPRASALGFFALRVLALWQCFQWSRADVLRAALIGVAVFVVAGAAFASTVGGAEATGSAGGDEVRAPRTLDQHTGRQIVVRGRR